MYVELRCGFRGVVKILSILQDVFKWDFAAVPNRNSIENWVKKSGYSIYQEPSATLSKEDYAMIVDESIMIGREKMLLVLGTKSEKRVGVPVRYEDIEVLDIGIRSSWNGQQVSSVLHRAAKKTGHAPDYVISDNGSTMAKGIRDSGYKHIRDVGHSLGMFMERIYKYDEEFKSYMKELSAIRFKGILTSIAYLLPPQQRTIARFLNLTEVVEWSDKMQLAYTSLNREEQKVFSFIPKYASFIDEMKDVLQCVNGIQKEIKHNGLSSNTLSKCLSCMKKHLRCINARTVRLTEEIVNYLRIETGKVKPKATAWNASSDIIESVFGTYKQKKSSNPLHGVTGLVLLLPLLSHIKNKEKLNSFSFKSSLENVFLSDIKQWEMDKLTENLASRRKMVLKCA